MTVYWIVWIATVALAFMCQQYDYPVSHQLTMTKVKHYSTTQKIYIILSIMLIIVAGCRYYVGTDFGAYYRGYAEYLDFFSSLISLDEPGVRLIYNIAIRIHDNGGTCILAVAAVTLGLELSTLYKNTDNIFFALILFVFTCWTSCFNGVRQALAAAVLFCGLPALRERNFIKYAIITCIAFLCHRSAIVMILVYFMVNRQANKKNIIILILLSFVVLFSYDRVYSVMNVVLDSDITGEEDYWSSSVNILRVFTEIIPAVFFVYMYRYEEKTPDVSFYLNLLVIHAVVAVTTSNSACLARMTMYTMPFAVIAMAELIKCFSDNAKKNYSRIILALFFLMELYEITNNNSLNNFQLRFFL